MPPIDIADVAVMAEDMLKEHGLWEKGWRFKVDRAKSRCGCCTWAPRLISMSKFYIQADGVTSRDIRNTMLHEIAHALAGPEAGHGPVWKQVAQAIGCDGERINAAWTGAPRRYKITCACGRINQTRHRLHSFYKNHTCRICEKLIIENVK